MLHLYTLSAHLDVQARSETLQLTTLPYLRAPVMRTSCIQPSRMWHCCSAKAVVTVHACLPALQVTPAASQRWMCPPTAGPCWQLAWTSMRGSASCCGTSRQWWQARAGPAWCCAT